MSRTTAASDRVIQASGPIASVTSGSETVTKTIVVGGANSLQISVLLAEFSNKISGSLDSIVQVSNDGCNWSQLISMNSDFSKAGTVQQGSSPVSARFLRVVTAASPAGNTVAYSLDVSLASL